MKCPNCGVSSGSIYRDVVADRGYPITCVSCGTKYYVRRFLSDIFTYGFIGSGLIFIGMFLVFGQYGWFGVSVLIMACLFIWFVLAKIENEFLPANELTEEMESSGKRYLFAIRLIVIGVLMVVIYGVFF